MDTRKNLIMENYCQPMKHCRTGLKTGSTFARVYSMELARKFNAPAFEKEFAQFVDNGDAIEKEYAEAALKLLEPSSSERIMPLIDNQKGPRLPAIFKLNGDLNTANIEQYIRSANPIERAWGAHALEKI